MLERAPRLHDDGDRYEILAELASGGMATVYLGRLRRAMGFARLVAIKCMHAQYAKDPNFVAMFVDEAKLTARLRHPNIVPTVDIVADAGQLLLVMEYVEGESLSALASLVQESGEQIPLAVGCAIVHDVLLGLHEAHDAKDDDGVPLGIIHRDVSPQNVIVGLDGLARLLDFGVAKARRTVHHSETGEIKGKIPYMAPEQLYGEALDRTVDVYAAGVLLWEVLVGTRLFQGANDGETVRRVADGIVVAPSTKRDGISAELDALILRAVSKSSSARFPTALEMAEQLSKVVSLPPRTEISAWMRRFSRRRELPQGPAPRMRSVKMGQPEAPGTRASSADASALEPTKLAEKLTTRHTMSMGGSLLPAASTVAPSARPGPVVLSLAAIALALAGVALLMPSRSAPSSPVAVVAAVPANTNVALPAVPALVAPVVPAPVSPRTEVATDAPSAVVVAAHAPSMPPVATTRASAVATPSASAPPLTAVMAVADPSAVAEPLKAPATSPPSTPPSTSCKPPYVVDTAGHRHYKAECL